MTVSGALLSSVVLPGKEPERGACRICISVAAGGDAGAARGGTETARQACFTGAPVPQCRHQGDPRYQSTTAVPGRALPLPALAAGAGETMAAGL